MLKEYCNNLDIAEYVSAVCVKVSPVNHSESSINKLWFASYDLAENYCNFVSKLFPQHQYETVITEGKCAKHKLDFPEHYPIVLGSMFIETGWENIESYGVGYRFCLQLYPTEYELSVVHDDERDCWGVAKSFTILSDESLDDFRIRVTTTLMSHTDDALAVQAKEIADKRK